MSIRRGSRSSWRFVGLGIAALAGGACDSHSGSNAAVAPIEQSLVIIGTPTPTVAINTTLATPLTVKATDIAGDAVPNVTVTWVVTSGGGTLSPTSVTTHSDGVASVA